MPRFDAVIFDMDGTLIEQRVDFASIRRELGISDGVGILEALAEMPDDLQRKASEVLLAYELRAAEDAKLKDGASLVLQRIADAHLPTALLTRNAQEVMEMILRRFDLRFDIAWSRSAGGVKPAPDGVLRACAELGVSPDRTACVGDFHYDILAAQQAGAVSILLADAEMPDFADEADYVISRLAELLDILEL